MEVYHLHKLIEDNNTKMQGFDTMFHKFLSDKPAILTQFNDYIEDNFVEYESDNSANQWNLESTKKRQKRVADNDKADKEDKEGKESQQCLSKPIETFSFLLKERFLIK